MLNVYEFRFYWSTYIITLTNILDNFKPTPNCFIVVFWDVIKSFSAKHEQNCYLLTEVTINVKHFFKIVNIFQNQVLMVKK